MEMLVLDWNLLRRKADKALLALSYKVAEGPKGLVVPPASEVIRHARSNPGLGADVVELLISREAYGPITPDGWVVIKESDGEDVG
jgi:hypothetical protein